MATGEIGYPVAQDDPNEYSFTPEERAEVERHAAKYPSRRSAVMPALWIAQEKYGWLPQKVIQLVADTIGESYAHVYGVATFYTMYLKEKPGKHLIEVCTCFGCSVTGGPEFYEFLREKLNVDEKGVSPDGEFWLREAECLGACDTAPMAQINNRRYVHKLTPEKADQLLETLRNGEEPPYEPIPLQDQSRFAQ